MSTLSTPQTPRIHEFSTGIYIEWLAGDRWRSRGFTGGWNNNTFGNTHGQGGIPPALDAAIRNDEFEVRAPEREVAVVGRVVQRQGDPQIWAVVAVVSNAVDNRGRGLPVWRYFCCVCRDITNANLELIRLLGKLETFKARHGFLPQFDPRSLSDQPIDFTQVPSALPPKNEPHSAAYDRALNATNTVILPLVLDAGTCHSYHQLLALAAATARAQGRLLSWAWNVTEVEQPGAFIAIQMAAGAVLRMRQAVAPVAEGSDVAALAAVLQEFGRNNQVKAETVAKLDELLRRDPNLKDPEILRQTYRQFGVEANKQFKIFQPEQLINPQQIRVLPLWVLLDPKMWPEYQRWFVIFPSNTQQGKISQSFQQQLKALLLPKFPDLAGAVGADVVWLGWQSLKEGKVSGAELAQQLTDPHSLFAPAPEVLCQTLGNRLQQLDTECRQLLRTRSTAPEAELVKDPYWSDLKNYLLLWSNKNAHALVALGVAHPMFGSYNPGSGGRSGDGLFSRDLKSWFNWGEGWKNARYCFQRATSLENVLSQLPSPDRCRATYAELSKFLGNLSEKPAYSSAFKPCYNFLHAALQPATISVSWFDLVLKGLGYLLTPVVAWVSVVIVGGGGLFLIALAISRIFQVLFNLFNPLVIVIAVLYLLPLAFLILVIVAVLPEITNAINGLFDSRVSLQLPFSSSWPNRTTQLLDALDELPDLDNQEDKQWEKFWKKYTRFLIGLSLMESGNPDQRFHENRLKDIYATIEKKINEQEEVVYKQELENLSPEYSALIRLKCFALLTIIPATYSSPKWVVRIFQIRAYLCKAFSDRKLTTDLGLLYSSTFFSDKVNKLLVDLGESTKTNILNLDTSTSEQQNFVQDLNEKAASEIKNFSVSLWTFLTKQNNKKSRECVHRLEMHLTAHLFTGLLDSRIEPDHVLPWIGPSKIVSPEALLNLLKHDRDFYKKILETVIYGGLCVVKESRILPIKAMLLLGRL